jgi:hypothetical protein
VRSSACGTSETLRSDATGTSGACVGPGSVRTAATARARDEYSLLPARYFVEHWWTWVAVERWPALAARLRDCERIVAESADRNARRAAAAEISEILLRAESATT